MPYGPGTYGPTGGGGGLAAPAVARQGIPQQGVIPAGAPSDIELSEIMQMLRGGAVGSERFLQALSLLVNSTLPQLAQEGQGQGPQGPEPRQAPAGGIASLLGG